MTYICNKAEQRAEIVENRERFGDLEVDLILGKNHNQAFSR